jgi:hypothetical protein
MSKSSVVKVRLDGPTAKLLRLYAKDHRISMGEFLERVLLQIDIEEACEDASDVLSIENRKEEGPGIPLEELMKRLKKQSKPKK